MPVPKKPQPTKSKRSYGWTPDLPDHRDLRYAAIAAPPKALPPKVDLRAGCSAVEDQGQLGSCTANALAGNLEFLSKKSTGGRAVDYSRLFIYYNERAVEGTIKQDAGAMIRDGVKTLAKLGVCNEGMWPYNIGRFTVKPTPVCYQQAQKHKVTSYHRIAGLAEMRQCLAEGYPFVFGFSVYDGFESEEVARTGVLQMPARTEQQLGGHAVMGVGYDDTTKRLLVRNSWGPDWGQGGYFTMPYEYASSSDLADDFWTLRAF